MFEPHEPAGCSVVWGRDIERWRSCGCWKERGPVSRGRAMSSVAEPKFSLLLLYMPMYLAHVCERCMEYIHRTFYPTRCRPACCNTKCECECEKVGRRTESSSSYSST